MRELGIEPTNHIRFAFWGTEGSRLLGSTYYTNQLSRRQLKNIAVNLNFDMIGSPNYVRFVYDGSDTPVSGPTGSGTIEDVFTDYFASQGLETDPTEFSGRSDYGPYIEAGVPAGGLFTGAEGIKTPEQAAVYGGVAGLAHDPCYHQACDTLKEEDQSAEVQTVEAAHGESVLVGNVNVRALDEMADGAAHATLTFAQTNSVVSGTDKASNTAAGKMEYEGPRAKK